MVATEIYHFASFLFENGKDHTIPTCSKIGAAQYVVGLNIRGLCDLCSSQFGTDKSPFLVSYRGRLGCDVDTLLGKKSICHQCAAQ